MNLNRRTAIAAGLGAAATAAAPPTTHPRSTATGPHPRPLHADTPTATNIPTARDPRASQDRYLSLLTTTKPPHPTGWYATYRIQAPHPGPYTLTAVATAPVETPHTEATASYLQLAVNNAPFTDLDHSQPHWYESPPAWGDLSTLDLGTVDLRRGDNTLTFRVTEPTVLDDTVAYALSLDRITLRPTRPAPPILRAASVPRHRAPHPAHLHLTLDRPAPRPVPVRYTVTDYFGHRATGGRTTIPAGTTTTTVALPADLPPGHYRVTAEANRHPLTTAFARLPATAAPTPDSANPFGVNLWATSLLPPSRLPEFASAISDMGAAWIRDGQSWPAVEPAPGAYDTAHHDRTTRTLRAHGLSVLDVLSPAPEWAMTDASLPLPADLRHAYRYARRLAAARPEALQLSNEPDVDTTFSTGDAHAAFVKAAALGVRDAADRPPLVVLPGFAQSGPFQDLVLANDVVQYADAWAFHGYPDPTEEGEPTVPGASEEQHALARRHQAPVPLWMTECGAFFTARPRRNLTYAQQARQARYLVRSFVEGLAAGNARQFWFAAPPLHDDGVYFGLFDRDFAPLPAYSAFAALTSLLGAARHVRPAGQLPAGAHGFVFDNGRGELVTVVWAERPVRIGTTVAYDVMGRRLPGGTVTVSLDPVYLVTPGARTTVATAPPARTRLSPAEHIVLSQRYAARNAAPGKQDGDAPPPYGYRLGRRTRMAVDVYNFGTEARYVTVEAGAMSDGWSVRADGDARVRVAAGGRVSAGFTVRAGRATRRREDVRITFRARLDDHSADPSEVPPSVALVHLK
ncbi:hypothetical protein [Streptomyces sp. NBC_00140]|uniref:hypothetical protein n=1 Tax=Streptomyces sp. NBC_00140 TaxID=2975664 RepID=UPI002250AB2C|nr:hypothetical protein [Streptomyces sp. NBC_00140]MCX5333519.1 hypothetical protein [Streptomyces sp. NBC_00140]